METPILLTPTIAIQFFLVFFLGMCVIKLIFSLPRKKVDLEIGRASCRERVEISVVAASVIKKIRDKHRGGRNSNAEESQAKR